MTAAIQGRILFVDDEPRVLEGLENLLFDAPGWSIAFAQSGFEALRMLEAEPFDVMVTDMRMPQMGGAELLSLSHARFPGVVRIVLSGHTEQRAAHEAMDLAHEFLSKPCETDSLISTLSRALALTHELSPHVRARLGGIVSLPVRPRTHLRLIEMIEQDAGIPEVADLIESEVALASKLMHLANTAFYSSGRHISDVRSAINRIGLRTTTNVVLAAEALAVFELPRWIDSDDLHAHSLDVATCAAGLVDLPHTADAMLAGLLHDAGRLVIAAHFPEGGRAAWELERTGIPTHEAEQSVLGFDHAAAGAYLLRLWRIPESVVDAVAHHHMTGLEEREPVDAAVFAATWVASFPEPGEHDEALSEVELEMVGRARATRRRAA